MAAWGALVLSLAIVTGLGVWWTLARMRHQRQLTHTDEHIERLLQAGDQLDMPALDDTEDVETPHAWWQRGAYWVWRSSLGKSLLDDEDRRTLVKAGMHGERYRAYYSGLRVLTAVGGWAGGAMLTPWVGMLVTNAFLGFAVGLFAPKWGLRAMANRREDTLLQELPMLIDVLRLLQGTGMSLDQSLRIAVQEFWEVLPVFARELEIANHQYAAGRSRAESLKRIVDVFPNEDVEDLMALLVQIEKQGGSVQEPMRDFGQRLREKRKARLRELVGRLNVKMTLVMITTLLPALMILIAGPAVQGIIKGISGLSK